MSIRFREPTRGGLIKESLVGSLIRYFTSGCQVKSEFNTAPAMGRDKAAVKE